MFLHHNTSILFYSGYLYSLVSDSWLPRQVLGMVSISWNVLQLKSFGGWLLPHVFSTFVLLYLAVNLYCRSQNVYPGQCFASFCSMQCFSFSFCSMQNTFQYHEHLSVGMKVAGRYQLDFSGFTGLYGFCLQQWGTTVSLG